MSNLIIAYTWSFDGFRVAPVAGEYAEVVKEIDWRLNGSAQGVSAEEYGTVVLGEPTPVHDYVPLEQVTPNQARIWAEQALGEDLDRIKANIAGQIRKKLAPPVVVNIPPPWQTPDVAE